MCWAAYRPRTSLRHVPRDVIAVVPTFRPGPRVPRLIEALRSATRPSIPIVISDDASPCSFDGRLRGLSRFPGTRVIRHARNAGIARGLNEGVAAAIDAGATWLLTVDQDSFLEPATLGALIERAAGGPVTDPLIGVLAPGRIEDASGTLIVPGARREDGLLAAPEIMQSGALWSVSALTAIGGFDETMGMDGVDAAACLSLREAGYLVLADPEASIVHEIGDPGRARTVRILGHVSVHTAHGPARRTSMVRARLRLFGREWRQSPTHALRTLRRVGVGAGLAVTLEPNRWAQAIATMRGVREGLRR